VTAPNRRPSAEGALGNHEKRISTLESIAPPAAGDKYRNSSVKYSLGGPEWKTAILQSEGSFTTTVDTTVPFGGYVELSGLNTGYIIVGMPLGPTGSIWGTNMAYRTATDGGKVIMEWQTQLTDALQFGATSYPEVVDGPDTSASWYHHNASTFDQDFYSAAPGDFFTGQYGVISPSGTGTTMLSAAGTAAPNPPYGALTVRQMNGGGDGSVMWYLRLRVMGQNASSSGYKARIYYLAVKRFQGGDGHELF
jgi:hypothetical protein